MIYFTKVPVYMDKLEDIQLRKLGIDEMNDDPKNWPVQEISVDLAMVSAFYTYEGNGVVYFYCGDNSFLTPWSERELLLAAEAAKARQRV